MKRLIGIIGCLCFLLTIPSIAQPYVVGETTKKIFSEDFSDISKSFPITSSKDPKFWGTYGDGYYYMERKTERPRVVLANFKGTTKDFYLKTKISLSPQSPKSSSVGVLFLAQPGGRGGFVLEFNKKKKFRIKDIGSGAFLSKEGTEGWIKSKAIYGPGRENKIEVKAFRGQFDIYFNGTYTYSFVNKSYKKGAFGAYIGALSEAKIIYYNVYELNIPNAPEEIIPEDLQSQIAALKLENDSLKTIALTAKYGGKGANKAAISAIKILEEQISASRSENTDLKKLLAEYEENEPVVDTEESQKTSEETVNKISELTNQRDSLTNRCSILQEKVNFMESHIKEVQSEIDAIRSQKGSIQYEKEAIKEPATPSEIVKSPSIAIPSIGKTIVAPVDSTYETTIDLDEGLEIEEDEEETSIEESIEEKTPVLTPIHEQEIPIQKAIKGEFKD